MLLQYKQGGSIVGRMACAGLVLFVASDLFFRVCDPLEARLRQRELAKSDADDVTGRRPCARPAPRRRGGSEEYFHARMPSRAAVAPAHWPRAHTCWSDPDRLALQAPTPGPAVECTNPGLTMTSPDPSWAEESPSMCFRKNDGQSGRLYRAFLHGGRLIF